MPTLKPDFDDKWIHSKTDTIEHLNRNVCLKRPQSGACAKCSHELNYISKQPRFLTYELIHTPTEDMLNNFSNS